MDWLRAVWFKLTLRRHRADDDFHEEVNEHMARLAERFVLAGMSPDEAGRAARRQFGNVALLKDVRADFGRLAIEAWWWDLRFAVRGLRRSLTFSAAAVLLLGLGIGANTAVFSVLDALFLRPLPVERPSELALVQLVISPTATFQGAAQLGFVTVREFLGPDAGIPWASFEKLRQSSRGFSGLTAEGGRTLAELRTANGTGELTQVRTAFVSGNYFTVLGVPPAAGRVLIEPDDSRAQIPAVVLSDRYWETHFLRDPAVVGRALYLNDTVCTVVGIARDGFDGSVVGTPTDVWVPLTSRASVWPTGASEVTVIGRLEAGVSRAEMQTRLHGVVPTLGLADAFGIPTAPADTFDLRVADGSTGVSSLRERHVGALGIGMGVAGVVLLIACANVAALVLARATARHREMALQISLGAGRWRIVRQICLQNAVLAVVGGSAGWVLAKGGGEAAHRAGLDLAGRILRGRRRLAAHWLLGGGDDRGGVSIRPHPGDPRHAARSKTRAG